jgi:acyl-CoA thioester hydrolase
MNSTFSIPVRVYYEDTDSGGVVYHSNYLNFMERARTEWLRALGFEQDELLREHGVLFAVSTANLAFHKPARFNELLAVTVALDRRGAASLSLKQQVQRGDVVLASAEVRIACIDAQRFVPVAIPAAVADAVLALDGAAGPVTQSRTTKERM